MAAGWDQSLAARVVVRVLGRGGEPVGAGFLAGPDLVATCAHVVADAVGTDPYGPAPTTAVRLDLPLFVTSDADRPPALDADVLRWQPIRDDGSGDIAILRVRGPLPAGARMPPVRRVDRLWGHGFRVLGFPEGLADGVWATGRIRGEQGTRWFQLQAAPGEEPVVEGFSGSPVWDDESGAVVGMTVAADASGRTTTAYLLPIDQVLGLDPELLPCPYRGLEPFAEEHAAFFFGREGEVDTLTAAVTQHPLVAVVGPSGAGKSSLVRAGLLPRLRTGGARIAELAGLPGTSAADVLGTAVETGTGHAERLADPDERPAAVRDLATALAQQRTVLLLDQFEEIAAAEPDRARELLTLVGEVVSALPRDDDGWPVRAVITLRSATIDEVVVPRFATLLGAGTVLVPPMERRQLREAVLAPAERAPGLTFEPGLVDRILDDAAAEPGALPLVESLLTELWGRRTGGMLTVEAYERSGGVAGVVATHAEEVVAGLGDAAIGPLRRLFTSLAAPDRDGRFARRPQRFADLAADLHPLVAPLVAGRLLVVERAGGEGDRIQLAHQALIAHWPRLREWLTQDRDFLSWRDQLEQQRDRWEAAGRDDGALLRGSALAVAQEWLPARTGDVSPAAREYVDRSRARQRREVRRWRVVTAVLAVLVLVAGGFGAVAVSSRNEVSAQLRLANAEILGQSVLTRIGADPATAAALALAAWQSDASNPTVRSALARLAMATQSVEAVYPDLAEQSFGVFGVSTDGMTVVIREDDRRMTVFHGIPAGSVDRWDVPDVPAGSSTARLTPDGHLLVVPDPAGGFALWDLVARTGPTRIDDPAVVGLDAGSLRLSPDGRLLTGLTPWHDGRSDLVVWDIARGAVVPNRITPIRDPTLGEIVPTSDPDIVLEAIQEPDGRILARALGDGTVRFEHPQHSMIAGPFVLTCTPDDPRAVLVRAAESGADRQRIGLLAPCTRDYLHNHLSADGQHLIEPRTADRERDVDLFRITSLAEGTAFELAEPPDTRAAATELNTMTLTAVVPRADGGRTVLLPRARSLVILRAAPAPRLPAPPETLILSSDGRYEVALAGDRLTVLDASTQDVLAGGTLPALPDGSNFIQVSDAIGVLTRAPRKRDYAEYALPSLAPTLGTDLGPFPDPPIPTEPVVKTTPERVVLLADGLVFTWDRRTGNILGDPMFLATTVQRTQQLLQNPVIAARPGPVPQVAVVAGSGGIELWNPVTGAQDGALPIPPARIPIDAVYDRTGTRMIVLGQDLTVQIWDVDRREPVSRPIAVTSLGLPQGLDADGYLVFLEPTAVPDVNQLTFWDVSTGRQSGSVRISTAYPGSEPLTGDGTRLRLNGKDGALPVAFPLTAAQWVQHLCRFTDRPFTAEERNLLPAGVDVERPCTGGASPR
ncbi:serine protease [Pseudonocardia adelaidensis]|uniref:serine protease n=1 Tax=Pseudonocardia adelaidensis TaxID=648754 RepID=UPI0031EB3F5C